MDYFDVEKVLPSSFAVKYFEVEVFEQSCDPAEEIPRRIAGPTVQ